MKILITGSSGYLGKRLVDRTLEAGHEVVGLDVKPSGLMREGYREIAGDVTDADAVAGAMRDCRAVFHIAAAPAQFERDEKRMHRINVEGTANVLAAALERGVEKTVFMSSVEVYGVEVPVPCPEDAPLNPVCRYGRDKVEGERLCEEYLARGLDITIFRPPTINGPGQNEPFLIDQIKAISRGKATLLPGGGRTRLQMVHVDDVAGAVLLALDKREAQGEVMNLGSDDVPTLRELASALYRHAGRKEKFISISAALAQAAVRLLSCLGISPLEPQHLEIALRDYVFDNTRAKEVLGWRPTRDDVETAVETYDWYVSAARP